MLSASYLQQLYSENKKASRVKDFFKTQDSKTLFKIVDKAAVSLNIHFGNLQEQDFIEAIAKIKKGLSFINTVYFPSQLSLDKGCIFPFSPFSSKEIVKATLNGQKNFLIDYYKQHVLPGLVKEAPDLIGISLSQVNQFIPGFSLAKLIKKHLNSHVVFGDNALSHAAMFLNKKNRLRRYFDSLIIGAGEPALEDLIEALKKNGSVSKVPNCLYNTRWQLRLSPAVKSFNIEEAEVPEYHEPRPRPIISIEGSQGCYWGKCTFCTRPVAHGYSKKKYKTFSEMPIDKLIAQLKEIKKQYDPLYIRLTDSAIPPGRLKDITAKLQSQNNSISIYAYIRAEKDFLSAQFCQKLARGGLVAISFGLESASQKMNNIYNKGISIANIPKILKNFSNAGIACGLCVMVGGPGENCTDMQATAALIRKNHKYIVSVLVSKFTVLLNSAIYHNPAKYNISEISTSAVNDIPLYFEHRSQTNTQQASLAAEKYVKQFSSQAYQILSSILKRNREANLK